MRNNTLKIGNVAMDPNRAFLAPMAGVCDLAFRKTCKDHFAGLTCSEMVSAKALLQDSVKTKKLLLKHPSEIPYAVQIFGSDPDIMGEAAALAAELSGADILDINMGCPTPKIVSNGDGSALLKAPALASRIIEEAVKRAGVPVTVKIRLGWDRITVNATEFARMAEASGASAICVHGRTREQMYSGRADRQKIAEVKKAVSIPVIANGDVVSADDAESMMRETGADSVMVGRGALGNPWLFRSIYSAFSSGETPETKEISLSERMNTLLSQITLAADYKGEHIALLEARKHFIWYLKGIRGAKRFAERITKLETLKQLTDLTEEIKSLGCGVTG